MKVKELMSTDIACIKESTSVGLIAKYMKKSNIGMLPICDDRGHLKGVVTDRDLVLRALASDTDIDCLKAADVMTANPDTVSPEANIHDAALIFAAKKIRRLPVMESSKLVGVLSLGDLAVKPVCVDEAGDALSAISISEIHS